MSALPDRATILVGDVLARLADLPDESVHCVVTSPPYFALRDYGTASWEGGDLSLQPCNHTRDNRQGATGQRADRTFTAHIPYRDVCGKCGATRVDRQIGLEARMDCLGWATGAPCGECHVCVMVRVFREVRRVLRRDGTCWMNYGDCYAAARGGTAMPAQTIAGGDGGKGDAAAYRGMGGEGRGAAHRDATAQGLKHKDLCMMPHRVALALQADGWWVRSDIVWAKANCMPESVTDRPTKAHEYIFLLARSERYYYDAEAIREPVAASSIARSEYGWHCDRPSVKSMTHGEGGELGIHTARMGERFVNPNGRNKRDVWTVPTFSFSEAHFATFPPDLIRPCILAGTSERGVCPACGAPYRRKSHTTYTDAGKGNNNMAGKGASFEGSLSARPYAVRKLKSVHTLGWQPGCKCNAGDPEPAIVLDPFLGSGTTVMVALEYGRKAVGIELNEEYVALARRRIAPALAQEPLRL